MRTFLSVTAAILLFGCVDNQPEPLSLLPFPQEVVESGGRFEIKKKIELELDDEFTGVGGLLKPTLEELNTQINSTRSGYQLLLQYDAQLPNGPEAYTLSVNQKRTIITANSPRGCFYGIQSLKQLVNKETGVTLPIVELNDFPDFSWRSYMLDEGRYFMGKEFVLGLLDEMADLKLNKFHWHLTEDAGWRIEIKKYPKLTEVGAFRDSTQINVDGKKWDSEAYDGKPHGGFYTQQDITEIVAYASLRGIDIVPEIEMPGHSSAAIAAYPWLGVIGELKQVPPKFGKLEDSYNISNPKVITFLHDVLDEVCELFPSKVIHIGGDEVLFGAWNESEEMQGYMKKHGLKTPADAQIRFTNEISNYLASKGKRMMGWNEILGQNIHDFDNTDDYESDTELSKQSVIHFWRGDIPLIADAAQKGYQIVNSLHSETYLDYSYDDSPLKRMYSFSPIPEGLDSTYHQYIIGVGAQMWTEWTPSYRDVEYMTFPRIAAIAEVAWSGTGNYKIFLERLRKYSNKWVKQGRNFPVEQIK